MSALPPCILHIGSDTACYGCEYLGDPRSAGRLSCTRRRLDGGQFLFMQGDARNQIFVVKTGTVRLFKMLDTGKRQIIGFKFAGEFIGLGPDAKHGYSAQAIGETELRVLQAAVFDAVAANDPQILWKLYEAVATDLARAHELALTIGRRSAAGSMAAFLLEIEAHTGAHAGSTATLSLPMRHADIADYLGLTHETVSRLLATFRRRGLIAASGRNGIVLKHHALLRALADGHPIGALAG